MDEFAVTREERVEPNTPRRISVPWGLEVVVCTWGSHGGTDEGGHYKGLEGVISTTW